MLLFVQGRCSRRTRGWLAETAKQTTASVRLFLKKLTDSVVSIKACKLASEASEAGDPGSADDLVAAQPLAHYEVEHKFFEEELEEMEHQQTQPGGATANVVISVDNSTHSEFAFNCE